MKLNNQLKEEYDYQFVVINGLCLTQPQRAYSELYTYIIEKKKKIAPDNARKKLVKYFKDGPKDWVIVLLDEVDYLITRKQEILYDFFDWANVPQSRFIVIAISNTVNLPEKVFDEKIQSRMGISRVGFNSYNSKQLIEIVQNRLKGFYPDLVTENAVNLACRSLETFSDVRRLLQVIRRALFLAEEENKKTNPSSNPNSRVNVSAQHISQTLKDTKGNPKTKILPTLSEQERLILASILSERNTEITLKTVMNRYDMLSDKLSTTALNGTEFNIAISNLINLGYIRTETPRKDGSHKALLRTITLNVDRTELIFDLRDDKIAVRVFGRQFFSNIQ